MSSRALACHGQVDCTHYQGDIKIFIFDKMLIPDAEALLEA